MASDSPIFLQPARVFLRPVKTPAFFSLHVVIVVLKLHNATQEDKTSAVRRREWTCLHCNDMEIDWNTFFESKQVKNNKLIFIPPLFIPFAPDNFNQVNQSLNSSSSNFL